MLKSDGESTPLLSSAKGGGQLKQTHPNTDGFAEGSTTRRRFNQQQDLYQSEQTFHPPSKFRCENNSEGKNSRFRTLRVNIYSCIRCDSLTPFPCRRLSSTVSKLFGGDRGDDQPPVDRIVITSSGQVPRKIYYEDTYNDLPWSCSFGTREGDGIWLNRTDSNGILMCVMVWILIVYSGFTVTLLAQNNSLQPMIAIIYCTLCALALASHAKTTFTDPGGVPHTAIPTEEQGLSQAEFTLCSICLTFKPQRCHHCRICNRCICGMDHHCPWMNNCIGSANLKHFILFLIYVWMLSAYAFVVFSINYFFCTTEECVFTPILAQMVRIMALMCVGTLLFTSNMIANVTWGIMTGTGTIDRMKRLENNTVWDSDEESIPLTDVFGIGGWYTWPFPLDPLFDDYDKIMGYSTKQRLLREKTLRETKIPLVGNSIGNLGGFDTV